MKLSQLKIINSISVVNYPYKTIKITQSRIDKGLISIPIPLAKDWFPKINTSIKVQLDDSNLYQLKNYSSYLSKTREARIGGLAQWFKKKKIVDGDEIVLQLIDKLNHIYRIIPEKYFINRTLELQQNFDKSESDNIAFNNIKDLSEWTEVSTNEVAINEYHRIASKMMVNNRNIIERQKINIKETVPSNVRILLEKILKGHCQLCDFFFLKKNKRPYFEIHHINPSSGHHPKNILLVCANCHRQFTYANVSHYYNENGWLSRILFNDREYSVKQIDISSIKLKPIKKTYI